jgi:hypothetical protein
MARSVTLPLSESAARIAPKRRSGLAKQLGLVAVVGHPERNRRRSHSKPGSTATAISAAGKAEIPDNDITGTEVQVPSEPARVWEPRIHLEVVRVGSIFSPH